MKKTCLRGQTRTLMRRGVCPPALWLALAVSPVYAQLEPVAVDAAASAPAASPGPTG